MHKLLLNNIVDIDFKLIGISTSAEAYKIAFLINDSLKTQFIRTSKDVEMLYKDYSINFSLYTYTDSRTDCKLYFIQNKSKYLDQNPKFVTSLFENTEQPINKYLISSHKQCDYLIKIEDEFDRYKIKKMIHDLNDIPQIISAYEINVDNLKTPQHLIFE